MHEAKVSNKLHNSEQCCLAAGPLNSQLLVSYLPLSPTGVYVWLSCKQLTKHKNFAESFNHVLSKKFTFSRSHTILPLNISTSKYIPLFVCADVVQLYQYVLESYHQDHI